MESYEAIVNEGQRMIKERQKAKKDEVGVSQISIVSTEL
jgi:hypothetical protein